jgi:hypothetical protein
MPHEQQPIACSLGAEERSSRLAAARELGERALVGVEVMGRRALLRFNGERERVDELVAAESECCAFFSFEIAEEGEETQLEIRTPPGGEWVLRGLVAGIVAGWERELVG